MGKIDKLSNALLKLLKGWNIVFILFLSIVSIPGYIHLVDLYNKEIPAEQQSVSTIFMFYGTIIFALFLCELFFVMIAGVKVTTKRTLQILLLSTLGAVDVVGYFSATDIISQLNTISVIFLLIYAFAWGMKATIAIVNMYLRREN